MANIQALTVTATGATVTTGAASARVAIPVSSAGAGSTSRVRYIRIAATVESYVKVGDVTVAATTNDVLVQPADSIVLCVGGAGYVAYIQGTATGKVNIVSLDDA